MRRAALAVLVLATSHAHAQPTEGVDLSSLGLDPDGFDDKLNIYGFADFSWQLIHWNHPTPIIQDTRNFVFGNLSVYLAKNLTRRARSLVEVRFLFAPNGSENADGSVTNTAAQDLGDFNRSIQWGGVVIERAYLEYDVDPRLTIRAGHWLTPYGIWNIDHGSPTIIGTARPYMIGEQLFPEHQTGLDLFGHVYLREYKLQYHATVSNGRSATEAQHDSDAVPALGGRIEVETPWEARIGASIYGGRATSLPATVGGATTSFEELAYGADAQWDHGGLHLQSEVIARDRHYLAGRRAARGSGFFPDGRDFGMYVLAGYRLDHMWSAMPYAEFQIHRPLDTTLYKEAFALHVGVNIRPAANFVVKVEGTRAGFISDSGSLLAGERVVLATTQLAWVF